MNPRLNWGNWPTTNLSSFEQLLNVTHELDSRRMEPRKIQASGRGVAEDDPGYNCSHMSKWRWLKNGTVFVPGFGTLIPTNHALGQIGSKIGVKIPKFLGPIQHDPTLVQQSLMPHMKARANDKELLVKVVARRPKTPHLGVDGTLRGVVGPGYSEIRDAQVLDGLLEASGGRLSDMDVVQATRSDAATYLSFSQPESQRLKVLSEVGDEVLIGFKLWNSEVGSRALGAAEFLHRMVCTNGMVLMVKGAELLYQRHSHVSDEDLRRLLRNTWAEIPSRLARFTSDTERLHEIEFSDPERELDRFLRAQPKYIRDAAQQAYLQEAVPTAYGVLQAITRTGVALREDPDRQLDLETLGGQYLQRVLARAA